MATCSGEKSRPLLSGKGSHLLPSRRLSPGDTTDAGSSHDETRPLKTPRLDKIGSFSIEEKIGEGGMGVVYRARDPRLQRTVAIKRIHPRLQESVDIRERFLTEARAIAAVSHPNIGQIHAIHEDEDPPYLVMEFLEGPSFEIQVEKQGPMSSAATIRVAISAARALRAAVRSGIIHRDVKPSNLLQDSRGVVKLVDFGLAGNLGENPQDEPEFLCTPQYGSPEQIQGWALDERSDIYSLGATLFHLLTGKPPFERDSRVDLMVAQVNEPARSPAALRSGIHPELALLVLRMLEKRPGGSTTRPWSITFGTGTVATEDRSSRQNSTLRPTTLDGRDAAPLCHPAGDLLARSSGRNWHSGRWNSARNPLQFISLRTSLLRFRRRRRSDRTLLQIPSPPRARGRTCPDCPGGARRIIAMGQRFARHLLPLPQGITQMAHRWIALSRDSRS